MEEHYTEMSNYCIEKVKKGTTISKDPIGPNNWVLMRERRKENVVLKKGVSCQPSDEWPTYVVCTQLLYIY